MNSIAWWVVAAVAIVAANAPLAILVFDYRDDDLTSGEKLRLAGFSPNQFLFLLIFFPVAAILTAYVARGLPEWLAWTLLFIGLALGAFSAWADDRSTFRGLYSFVPKKALELAGIHEHLTRVLESYSGEDRQIVEDVIREKKESAALDVNNIRLPKGDTVEKLQTLHTQLAKATGKDWRSQGREHNRMRVADFLELTWVIATAFLLVCVTGYLVIRGDKESVVLCTVAASAFFPWIGLKLYSDREIYQATSIRSVSFPAVALASVAFLLLVILFVYAFADQKIVKSLLGAVSALIGLGTIGTSIVSPASARRFFGCEAHWAALVILAFIYITFLVIWSFLLLPSS